MSAVNINRPFSSGRSDESSGYGASITIAVTLLLIAVPIIGMLSGCGGEDDVRLPVHPVSGRVTFGGKAPEGAQVVLHPAAGTPKTEGVNPVGSVGSDGAFKISTYGKEDGAPAGEYVATVEWFKIVKEGGRGPNVLPKKYASADSSPVKITVAAGPNDLPAIVVK